MLEEAVKIYYETKGIRTPNIYKNSLYENLQNDDQIHPNVFIITINSDSKTNIITARLLSHILMDMTAITHVCIVSEYDDLLERSMSDVHAYKKFKQSIMQSNNKMNAYTINKLVSYQLGGDGDKPLRSIINSLTHKPDNYQETSLLSHEFLHKIINNVKHLHFDVVSTAELTKILNEHNNAS